MVHSKGTVVSQNTSHSTHLLLAALNSLRATVQTSEEPLETWLYTVVSFLLPSECQTGLVLMRTSSALSHSSWQTECNI